jgi:hypothetical protein
MTFNTSYMHYLKYRRLKDLYNFSPLPEYQAMEAFMIIEVSGQLSTSTLYIRDLETWMTPWPCGNTVLLTWGVLVILLPEVSCTHFKVILLSFLDSYGNIIS